MAFMAVLESDLRALSAEARRRYPAIKDGAEHAILKLRSLSSSNEIAQHDDILRIFLMACEVKIVKLSVIGLSCLQKLIAHDAVAPSALNEILATLKDHGEMADEGVQLKTLQTVLIIFQSRLQPDGEEHTAQALGICLRLLENNKSSDSVRNDFKATILGMLGTYEFETRILLKVIRDAKNADEGHFDKRAEQSYSVADPGKRRCDNGTGRFKWRIMVNNFFIQSIYKTIRRSSDERCRAKSEEKQ